MHVCRIAERLTSTPAPGAMWNQQGSIPGVGMHQVMLSNPESLITGRLWSAGYNSTAVQFPEADYRGSVLCSVQIDYCRNTYDFRPEKQKPMQKFNHAAARPIAVGRIPEIVLGLCGSTPNAFPRSSMHRPEDRG